MTLLVLEATNSNVSTATPVGATWSFVPVGASRDIPPVLNSSQAYYWTRIWQQGEREALEELRQGQGRVFADSRDAVRWLLSTDED